MELLGFLKERNLITDTTFKHVVDYLEHWNCSDYDALIETNIFTQSDIANFLAEGLKIERIQKLSGTHISENALAHLPFSIVYDLSCVPLRICPQKTFMDVVFFNPLDGDELSKISRFIKMKVNPVVAEKSEILKTIRMYYPTADQLNVYEQN